MIIKTTTTESQQTHKQGDKAQRAAVSVSVSRALGRSGTWNREQCQHFTLKTQCLQ